MPRQPSDPQRHLVWLFIQGFVFMPLVVAPFWSNEPIWIPGLVLNFTLACWLTYALARNLIGLWRLPESQTTRGILIGLALVAMLFALSSARWFYAATNEVVAMDEGKHVPLALTSTALAVAVWVLAIRSVARAISRRSNSAKGPFVRQA